MFILAKSADDTARIRNELTDAAPTSASKIYDFELSDEGLAIVY